VRRRYVYVVLVADDVRFAAAKLDFDILLSAVATRP
jgi:hypothetical protein